MKPGPELDALVAEKVMGCQPKHNDKPWAQGMGIMQCECGDPAEWDYPHGRTTQRGIPGEIRQYSTDLTTCAAAAEEARKAGKIGQVKLYGPCHEECEWDAWVDRSPAGFLPIGTFNARAATPAHALALALLKAVGHE